jgi:hypothetical protein
VDHTFRSQFSTRKMWERSFPLRICSNSNQWLSWDRTQSRRCSTSIPKNESNSLNCEEGGGSYKSESEPRFASEISFDDEPPEPGRMEVISDCYPKNYFPLKALGPW